MALRKVELRKLGCYFGFGDPLVANCVMGFAKVRPDLDLSSGRGVFGERLEGEQGSVDGASHGRDENEVGGWLNLHSLGL